MRSIPALLVSLMALIAIIACSEKAEDIVAEPEPEPEPEVIEPKPQPDWADNEMTITVNVKTAAGLLNELKEGGYSLYENVRRDFMDPKILSLTDRPYTAIVTVVTMKEAGIDRALTLPEVKERYKELGYRLLTFQEAIELRLQLHDQPDVASGHKWSAFLGLVESAGRPDKVSAVGRDINIAIKIFNARFRDIGSRKGLIRQWYYDRTFSPSNPDPLKLNLLRVIHSETITVHDLP